MLADNCEDTEAEKRMDVKSIPVKQSRLRFDKGNIKKKDMHSFKLYPTEQEQIEETKAKLTITKLGNAKRSRFSSEWLLRSELNQMDSWVILKEMSKKNSEYNGSRSKILEEDDDSLFFMNDCQNEVENIS